MSEFTVSGKRTRGYVHVMILASCTIRLHCLWWGQMLGRLVVSSLGAPTCFKPQRGRTHWIQIMRFFTTDLGSVKKIC